MEASALRAPAALGARRPGGVLLRLRTDEQLVALFRRGDEDAFRVIHDRYRQRLSAYARQMLGGSATDADDAMQDVFLRAYAALRADDRPITLRAWLYRVAHNRCIDHIRRPASQPMVELSEATRPLPATTGDPILAAERREDLRRLVVDVRALPEQQRSALLMREMEGLTYQELAGALEVTVPAIKSLLVRARMGLVESQQARDTPCQEIREDITAAHDRGVRMSGRARRHARECDGCAGYRATLRAVTHDLGALSPAAGPWGFLAKLIGLGAGGSGAAGGAAAAGGAGVGAAGVTATGTVAAGAAASKLAAVVCCAVVVGGGAVEVARERAVQPRGSGAAHAQPASGRSGAEPAAASTARPASASSAFLARTTATARRDRATRGATTVRPDAAAAAHRRAGEAPLTAMAPGLLLSDQDRAEQTAVDPDGGASAPLEDPAADDAGAGSTTGGGAAGVLSGLLGAPGGGSSAGAGSSGTTGPGTGAATGTGGTSAGSSTSGSTAGGSSSGGGSGAGTAAPSGAGPAAGSSSAPGSGTSGSTAGAGGSTGTSGGSAPGAGAASTSPPGATSGGASAPAAP
ncbi:RNA polymerase sigma factor [Paraconexibacter sp. AEG42_29]|uniref:RNA polymerase sigma factor n=1 Tax=Paraconexibacter sp. AEG42_29 TaxID=2997339 RepID=A0AAU7ASC7_9ACTN